MGKTNPTQSPDKGTRQGEMRLDWEWAKEPRKEEDKPRGWRWLLTLSGGFGDKNSVLREQRGKLLVLGRPDG